MAKVKYIISFFLFLAVFLFIGESYTYFLENFQDSYTQVGYFLPTGESEQRMNSCILEKADDFGTSVFALEKKDQGAFSRTITIYASNGVKEVLRNEWNIKPETVNSFFSGTTTLSFEPFEKATEKIIQNCWYPDKSPNELYPMVYPGMIDYSGTFRNEPVSATSKFVVAGVWLVLLLAILLLTAYDISYNRKEQSVRIILGSDNRTIIKKKIGADIMGFSVSVILAFIVLIPFTAPEFELPTTLACFSVVMIANTALLVLGMCLRRRSLLKENLSKRVLSFSMGLKALTSGLMVIVLSVTLGLSIEGIKLYSQKNYYETQHNATHVDIDYPYDYEKMETFTGSSGGRAPLNTQEQLQDNFLRYSYKNLDCSLLYSHSYQKIAPRFGKKYIFANLQGLRHYREFIPNWEKLCSSEGNYILVPENCAQEDVVSELLSFGNILGISSDNLNSIIIYKDGLSVISEGRRDGEYDYSYRIKNPIIILDTYDYGNYPFYEIAYSLHEAEPLDGIIYNNVAFFMQFISVKNNPEQIQAFAGICEGDAINSNLIEFSFECVGDWFSGLWALQNRSLLIAVILTLLLFILEFQITTLVLRIAYEYHAKELTVKKVLGYSMIERYRIFFVLSGVICGLSLIIAFAVFLFVKIGVLQYMIAGSLIIWLIDWLILIILTRKNDKLEIQRVLKGGI